MSNPASSGPAAATRDELFAALADARSRTVLRLVGEESPQGIGKNDLAVRLAAVTTDKRLADVTEDDHRQALVELHHRLVPRLTDAGLLEETGNAIRTDDHRAFDALGVDAMVSGHRTADADALDAVFEALADERRRAILAVLSEQSHPISTETLARDVAAREADTTERAVSQERVDRVVVSLGHVHLPLLCDADLVGYDDARDHVSYEGHPVVRTEWIQSIGGTSPSDDTTDTATDASERADVHTLERPEPRPRNRRSQFPL
ncbi:DUF7344 domain-containing protein [Natrinema salaciae]|uniref:DUF7344 domain-containing protein n=1 Tax=Natrinema salaciae TaxID=1186196 RepID=A0A1H9EGL6_9EURY|nr:hypothetical protein [Natrinema salaciae]SEQ24854.1 hypothetical protein SAMN04489841_1288 [Natrinema salaciae]